MTFDDNGWLQAEQLDELPICDAWSLLSPEESSVINHERLAHQARRFFGIDLTLATPKQYPTGGWPRYDSAHFDIVAPHAQTATRVRLQTLPIDRADRTLAVARELSAQVGGFDVLVGRARRLWQVHAHEADDPGAPLGLTAVLASVLLAPVIPPDGNTMFGVKGVRIRLEKLGWRV